MINQLQQGQVKTVEVELHITGENGGQTNIDSQEGFAMYLKGLTGNHLLPAAPL